MVDEEPILLMFIGESLALLTGLVEVVTSTLHDRV